MRDPNRIDEIAQILRGAWHLQPDCCLTQLVKVLLDKTQDLGALWHVEGVTMAQRLRRENLQESKSGADENGEPSECSGRGIRVLLHVERHRSRAADSGCSVMSA